MQRYREEWGWARQIREDLWRVRLDNPRGSLIVNTFVHRGAGEIAVIDPGWPYTLERLDQALRTIGIGRGVQGVDAFVYTHAHIDHMGAAALLEAQSPAVHVAWSGLKPHLGRWHAFQDELHEIASWIDASYVEPHRSELLARANGEYSLLENHGPAALDRIELVDFGQSIDIGELSLTWVDARGHDPHHAALWEPNRRWLFSGDAVLAVPTPICQAMDDDLQAYRATLERLEALEPAFLLPGHGLHRDENITEAFERSRGFVSDYETRTLRALQALGEPVDLYRLSLELAPNKQPMKPFGRWWVHMALVDSHLHGLMRRGVVERREGRMFAAV